MHHHGMDLAFGKILTTHTHVLCTLLLCTDNLQYPLLSLLSHSALYGMGDGLLSKNTKHYTNRITHYLT